MSVDLAAQIKSARALHATARDVATVHRVSMGQFSEKGQRFYAEEVNGVLWIRAAQGHSSEIARAFGSPDSCPGELAGLATCPERLYRGTDLCRAKSTGIFRRGKSGARFHVHLAATADIDEKGKGVRAAGVRGGTDAHAVAHVHDFLRGRRFDGEIVATTKTPQGAFLTRGAFGQQRGDAVID